MDASYVRNFVPAQEACVHCGASSGRNCCLLNSDNGRWRQFVDWRFTDGSEDYFLRNPLPNLTVEDVDPAR